MPDAPLGLLIFSLAVVVMMVLMLLLLKSAGRPLVLVIGFGISVFMIQQAIMGFQVKNMMLANQAMGSAAFFGALTIMFIVQMINGISQHEPAQPYS